MNFKITEMKKNLNNYPFIVQLITLPLTWFIAILKILIMIPIWITAKCNTIIEDVE
jgi:hypothetical protein